ncbi:MAG: hypothetical protein U9O63_07250 [Actinomycetota bacterium]|nr:hypothetical protein [Actinomycetota bacterium]
MRRLLLFVALVLVAAACSSGDETASDTTTSAPPNASTTAAAPTTAGGGSAMFAIEMVTFGEGAMVVITNTGTGAGELAGHWLCQRPSYFQIPDVALGPGEQVAIALSGDGFAPPAGALTVDAVATVGTIDPASGELGLYSASQFDDATAIVSYVEWGSAGHGRSSVAVAAGIWTEGGFVATTSTTASLSATPIPATGPDDWSAAG